ncbi:hypothetical protein CF133_22475 [Aeromonas salmonicida]|nr:hypothetical protein CF133_22475 [Aeromonas salmonicida]
MGADSSSPIIAAEAIAKREPEIGHAGEKQQATEQQQDLALRPLDEQEPNIVGRLVIAAQPLLEPQQVALVGQSPLEVILQWLADTDNRGSALMGGYPHPGPQGGA